jgi:predicted TPR repeat methyltransferase
VLSADTLVYFGDLEPPLAAARGGLRPDGLLVFTVEACADEVNRPWELLPHGRYAHTRSYVEAVLASAGLALLGIAREVLRFEAGDPVNGWVVTARKRGPAFR